MTNKPDFCKCLYYSSNALARVVTRMAEDAFAAVDLAPSHAFIVMTVNKNPGIQAGELAEIMMLKPSTVTRLVEKLENQHLVKKHSEGRSVMIYPTPQSVELNEAVKTAWYNLYQRFVAVLGEETASQITGQIYQTAVKLNTK